MTIQEDRQMSDAQTPETPETAEDPSAGERLDALLVDVRQSAQELRQDLEARASEVGPDVIARVDALSAKVDELQAAWAKRTA